MPLPSLRLCIALLAGEQGLTHTQDSLYHPLNVAPSQRRLRKQITCPGPTATAPPSGHLGEM